MSDFDSTADSACLTRSRRLSSDTCRERISQAIAASTKVRTPAVTSQTFRRGLASCLRLTMAPAPSSDSRLTTDDDCVLPQEPVGAGSVSNRANEGLLGTFRQSLGPAFLRAGIFMIRRHFGQGACLPALSAENSTFSKQ